MIKKIPKPLYEKEYSDNISYYNFNNLIENYEAIFNISNFDVPEYSKTYFTNVLETYASLFKKIKDAPLPNKELQKTVSSLKEMKIKDLSLIFVLKDEKENDAIEIFSEIYRSKNYDSYISFSLIKCLINIEPFVTFDPHEFKNDYINFYNSFNIKNLEEIQFVENIQKVNPDLSIANLYLVFFINKIISKELKDNNIYPDDIGLKNLFYSNNSVELGDNILRKINGENIELTNPFETLFLSWLEDTFVTNSNEPESFELFDESKIEQKPYVITEPLIYFKSKSLKEFSDEFINATVDTVNKQYTDENNLSYSANYVQKLTLVWESKESTQQKLERLNNIFYYYFHPTYVNFYNSLFNLINFAQVENRYNKNLQNEMFDKNLIFVNNKTSQVSSFNYTSNINIKNINRYEPKKSLLKKTLQEANQEFTLKEFKVKAEHKGKTLLSVYDGFIVERFLDKALDLSEEQFLTNSCEYSYETFVYQNNEDEFENIRTTFNSNSSHITSSVTFNGKQIHALKEICLEQGNKKLPVLFVPKMDNKSKKETIEIRNSTYKTLLNKKGVLIPVLLPIKVLNELNEEKIVSCFTFLSYGFHINNYSFKVLNDLFLNGINQLYYDIGCRTNIRNCSSELNVLNNLINTFFAYDSVFFKDKDLYLEKINKFYGGINCYADNNLNLIKESQNSFNAIKSAKDTIHLGKDYSNPIYAKVFAKVKVDEKLKLKYEKINKKYLKIESTYKEELETVEDLTDQINYAQQKIQELTERLAEKTEKKQEFTEKVKNTYETFDFIRKTKNELKEAYLKNYNENLKDEKKLTINPYLFNSLSNNINVSYVLFKNDSDQYLFYYNSKDRNSLYKVSETLHDKYYNEEEINSSSEYQFEDYQDVLPSILNGGYKIIKVCFTTVKPNLIKIDNTENYVVGGPYRLIVTEDSLKVGLLNLSSIFGTRKHKSKINEIKPHPHTSGINVYPHKNVQQYMYPQNACLGEATSLIYNAFNDNDLVKIIISTMIWVKSANSADYWGKTYNWFPKPETINCDFEELVNLPSVTEIDSFIDTVLEEELQQEESNEELNEQTVSNEETVQPQTERNIEEYNTDQVYRRYIS